MPDYSEVEEQVDTLLEIWNDNYGPNFTIGEVDFFRRRLRRTAPWLRSLIPPDRRTLSTGLRYLEKSGGVKSYPDDFPVSYQWLRAEYSLPLEKAEEFMKENLPIDSYTEEYKPETISPN